MKKLGGSQIYIFAHWIFGRSVVLTLWLYYNDKLLTKKARSY